MIDDFVPIEGPADSALQNLAERLFRAAGNHQGRTRMIGCSGLHSARPPRGLILATGEQVPRGHSLRARLLTVEVAPGEVDRARLSECQRAAQQGQLASAMSAFLSWIASRYEELQPHLKARARELRSRYDTAAPHARVPGALAELQSGWEIWLQFAFQVSAIGATERADLEHRSERVLQELAVLQAPYHQTSDPAWQFLAQLRAALAEGRAHVADGRGRAPTEAAVWGWQRRAAGRTWRSGGVRIGWVAGMDVFLDSVASYQVAQQRSGAARLTVSQETLRRRLRERGLLASIDAGRQMLLVRRRLEGCPRQVLHLRVSDLLGRG